MGTSQSMPTPTGGKWTGVKSEISEYLSGGNITPQQIISSTLNAAGGLSLRSSAGSTSGGASATGSGGGSGASGGGRIMGGRSSPIGRAASGLAGFGTALGTGGLARALDSLGIEDLRGKPAGEVISRIADHLSDNLHGLEKDVLRGAIQQAIYNAAELIGDPTYENLEASLQAFLSRDGVEGLIELFLTQYVFDRIWLLIEDYISKRTDSAGEISNMEAAIEHACRSNVHDEVEQYKADGTFNNQDWFGRDGLRVAEAIASGLEGRLRAQGAIR
jgi:hypothetical protein